MLLDALKLKLKEFVNSNCTLLWLEGSRYEQVIGVKIMNQRLVLKLANSASKLISFDRYTVTAVGLQFWNQGIPSVLYRWEQTSKINLNKTNKKSEDFSDDDPNPPNMAA